MESDEVRRTAKFLCSFGGSILPRPLDGRLRYVGGETRIVAVARDISYASLLARMRELMDGVDVIKYQQPDEDLDALVSVVNDDDVVNMMEEYDKLMSVGDGIVRLRVFLFAKPMDYYDVSPTNVHYDAAEREAGRRYVDALNGVLDIRTLSPRTTTEQSNGGIPGHLNLGTDNSSWNSTALSTGHYGFQENPPSSASVRFFKGAEDHSDRISNEFRRTLQLPAHAENNPWLPPGTVFQENAGFPGNLGRLNNFFLRNNSCSHCCSRFQRSQCSTQDARFFDSQSWRHGHSHFEQCCPMEYAGHLHNRCAECYSPVDPVSQAQESRVDSIYVHEQKDYQYPFYSEYQGHERVRLSPNTFGDPRDHLSGIVGSMDPYAADKNTINPHTHVEIHDMHSFNSSRIIHENSHHVLPSSNVVNGINHSRQVMTAGCHHPSAYVVDNLNQMQHNLTPALPLRRQVKIPSLWGAPHESPVGIANASVDPSFVRATPDNNPRFVHAVDRVPCPADHGNICQEIGGLHVSVSPNPEYQLDDACVVNQSGHAQKNRHLYTLDQSQHVTSDLEAPIRKASFEIGASCMPASKISPENSVLQEAPCETHVDAFNEQDTEQSAEIGSDLVKKTAAVCADNGVTKSDEIVDCNFTTKEISPFLPKLAASNEKAVVEHGEKGGSKIGVNDDSKNTESGTESEAQDSSADHNEPSEIETTSAEAEALSKGLQTIKNDDLEEIKKLGSGTFGEVYHGKWRGTDVAIKRIKATCFSGKPSERERLISDFWREALILSSLHHPNVVALYGVVRDGPDGRLATVNEFMVNGSLKKFLQKKDRTIDRRKRLIIAMDTAYGMEYLHEKNIVHFDLKCENLLVNMRDPQRPICKIGDLGLSKVKQRTLVSGGVRGTLPWMAPELLSGKSNMVSNKIDVYSFGVVMWELLTGEEPYANTHCASIIGGVVNDTLRPEIPTWCDPEWRALMGSCWSSDPADRPSFSEVSQRLRKMAAAANVK